MARTFFNWMADVLDSPALRICFVSEVGSRLEHGQDDWRAKGSNEMRVLDSMVVDGFFDDAPDPTATIVSDIRYRPGTTGSFINLPTQEEDSTEYVQDISSLANGPLEFEVRARDTSDNAVSPWVRRSIVIDNPTEEPPPDPVPGDCLTIAGESYRVLADEPTVNLQTARSGRYYRSFSGNRLRAVWGSQSDKRSVQCTIYDLTDAQLNRLLTDTSNQKRVWVSGPLIGEDAKLCTVTLEEQTIISYLTEQRCFRTRVRVLIEEV